MAPCMKDFFEFSFKTNFLTWSMETVLELKFSSSKISLISLVYFAYTDMTVKNVSYFVNVICTRNCWRFQIQVFCDVYKNNCSLTLQFFFFFCFCCFFFVIFTISVFVVLVFILSEFFYFLYLFLVITFGVLWS